MGRGRTSYNLISKADLINLFGKINEKSKEVKVIESV